MSLWKVHSYPSCLQSQPQRIVHAQRAGTRSSHWDLADHRVHGCKALRLQALTELRCCSNWIAEIPPLVPTGLVQRYLVLVLALPLQGHCKCRPSTLPQQVCTKRSLLFTEWRSSAHLRQHTSTILQWSYAFRVAEGLPFCTWDELNEDVTGS